MKRKIGTVCLAAMFAAVLTGCFWEKETTFQIEATVEKTEENLVVIKVVDAEENTMLVDVMAYLQTNGALSYTITGGMITGINGKNNPADFSSCWMLYTSDLELSNTEWGTVTVDGKALGGALFGAEALPVADGELYVWSYQSF